MLSAQKLGKDEGVETTIAPTIAEEKVQRRLELKARSTLLMGIPNEHQLKFNSFKDAQSLPQAVEKRFGGNAATKKTQINLLKQQYENFIASSLEVLDQTFDRLQKLIKEIDLRWQMVMLTMRARRLLKNTRRKLTVNDNETIGFNKFKVECYNCHKRGYFTREYRARRNQENRNRENTRRVVPVETTTSNDLVSCDGSGYDWSDQAEEGPTNFALMAYSSTSSNSDVSTDSNCSSSCLENVKILKEQNEQLLKDLIKQGIMLPYTGNFMPPKPDLSFSSFEEFTSEPIVIKPIVEKREAKASEAKPKAVMEEYWCSQ
ncbi:hypothetical protein Tco_0233562 [Tanacetum coccineum]